MSLSTLPKFSPLIVVRPPDVLTTGTFAKTTGLAYAIAVRGPLLACDATLNNNGTPAPLPAVALHTIAVCAVSTCTPVQATPRMLTLTCD